MKKLTGKEINYILGMKNTKVDWMFEGTLEELDNDNYKRSKRRIGNPVRKRSY